jgi:hypothetical protein
MCCRCKLNLPETDFYVDRGRATGRQSKCKKCQRIRFLERMAQDAGKVRETVRRSQAKGRRRRLYGISDETYQAMVVEQEGRCRICNKIPPPPMGTYGGLVIDHCHRTQVVRGLLCHSCNRGIGLLGDDPETIQRAYEYITRRRRPM